MKLGVNLKFNLETLVDTRLLIQANSGGGKSWAIRKLLEETHGKVQHIVLDIEGEFSTLREKFDYILAGKSGDIGLQIQTAELLAHKALELRADLIADLYELKQHERIRFVRLFLEALINAPKNLWHPVLVVVDEAHIFCPEKGHAESAGAVIDLCTRGRKRGFCGVLATQRLSKLHKDAAAECNNKLIGRTGLDIDVKRAADELGLDKTDAKRLRSLHPGYFYAYGPALSPGVEVGQIGEVRTTHPKAGHRKISHKPEPTKKIVGILEKLSDLPQQAAEEARTKEEMKATISELKKQLRQSVMNSQSAIDQKMLDKMEKDWEKRIKEHQKFAVDTASREAKVWLRKILLDFVDGMQKEIEKAKKAAPEIGKFTYGVGANAVAPDFSKNERQVVSYKTYGEQRGKIAAGDTTKYEIQKDRLKISNLPTKAPELAETLGKCERSILGFLHAKRHGALVGDRVGFTKMQIGAMTGYAYQSGNFNNCMGKLLRIGALERQGDTYRITEPWHETYSFTDVPHKLQDWISKLGACERAIYEHVLKDPERVFAKEEIGHATGYVPSSGNFNNCLGRLNTLGLIWRRGSEVRLNPEIASL